MRPTLRRAGLGERSAAADGLDAVVVGSGPNGLAAAITLARAGRSVLVYEAAPTTVGGGTRTAELTLPGFLHDVCSTILPLALASPFFPSIDLARTRRRARSTRTCPVAHPLDGGGRPSSSDRSRRPRIGLGRPTGGLAAAVRAARHATPTSSADILGPSSISRATRSRWPGSGCRRCGRPRARPARGSAANRPARCSPGSSAHAMLRLDRPLTASFGLVLATYAHAVGWPMVRGGAAAVADALAAELEVAGGEIVTGHRVASLDELPPARAVLFDVTPRQLVAIAGDRLPPRYRRRLERLPLRPGRVQARLGAGRPDPVGGRGAAPRRRRSTSAARSRRSRPPRRTSPPAATPSGRSCWSSRRAVRPDPGARRASPRPGRTATSRTARRST